MSERLFEQSCAARSGQPVSSLVSAGRGGLQAGPERPLSGFYLADRTTEGNLALKRPSTPAGYELPAAGVEVAPVMAFLACDG